MKCFPYFATVLFSTLACGSVLADDLVLPISFDSYSLPMVELDIRSETYVLMLDTGSGEALHLSRDMLERIGGARFTGETQRSTDMAGNVHENARFVIDALPVEHHVFHDVHGVELTPWGVTPLEDAPLPDSPVIGLGLFSAERITIDYPAQRLIVHDPGSGPDLATDTDWIEVPFHATPEGLVLNVTIAEHPHDMVLDSGATLSLILADHIGNTKTAVPCDTVYDGLPSKDCLLLPLSPIIDEVTTDAIYGLLWAGAPDGFEASGLLGGDFLQRYAVHIDFPGRRMYLRAAAGE